MKNSKNTGMSDITSQAKKGITNYVIGGLSKNNDLIPQDIKGEAMANLNNKVEANKIVNNSNKNQMK